MKYIVNKGIVIAVLSTMLFSLAEGMNFGIKAGLNITTMHCDDIQDLQSKIGFCGGGFATLGVGDIFVIQPEALYTQKGAKWDVERTWIGTGPYEVTFIYDYIEIPLLFKLVLPVKGGVKPNLFVGPYFAINVNAQEKMKAKETSEEWAYDVYAKDADLGVALGAGVDFSLKKGKIVFDSRYTFGLTTASEYGFDKKNKVVSFMLGYSF